MPDEALTPMQVARRLGVHPRTLKRWRSDGTGPPWFELPSGHARYSLQGLDDWIDAMKKKHTPPRVEEE